MQHIIRKRKYPRK